MRKTAQALVFGLLMLAAGTAVAQVSAQDKPVSPRYPAVVDRLQAITVVPLPDWRVHDDSVLHPENPSLDESGWKTMKVGEEWNTGPRWFRRWVEIPRTLGNYDVRGATVRFRVRISGENPVFLRVFRDGELIAEGNDLDPLVLTTQANSGTRMLLAVKGDVPGGRTGLWAAQLEIGGAQGRPDPRLLLQELVALNKLIGSFAEGQAERVATFDAALAAIDFAALDHGDQVAFDTSLRQAQSRLEPLRAWVKQFSIYATGNSHIDMAWLWPWTETVEVVRNTFGTVLQLMREYPQFTFTHGSAVTYAWMQEKYPRMFEQIRQRVKEGRWEPMGGMWVEPDLNLPDGESLVRQLLVGKKYFKDTFGVDVRTGWNPDSFGYSWQLPQIYKKSGIDYFVTQKIYWNDTTKFPHKIFWWEGPDGSRLLTYFPHGYGNPIDPVEMARDLGDYTSQTSYPELMHLYGVGDHGGGPTRSMLETAERWQKDDVVYPKLALGGAQAFFDKLAQKAPWLNIPTWKSELYLEYHRGVYTSQAETKRNNRRNEELLLNTEKFSALAGLFGQDYPQSDLTYSWRKVLFNQFHDVISGSSVAAVYHDADRDHAEVRRIGNEHLNSALEAIHARVNTSGPGVAVMVFNPLAWERTEVVRFDVTFAQPVKQVEVRDPAGKVMLSDIVRRDPETNGLTILFAAEQVPALGYKVFHFVPVAKAAAVRSPLRAAGNEIENEFLRVRVDPATGCITSIYDKRAKREALEPGSCGNLLQAFHDLPREYDAWNIDANFEDKKWDVNQAESVKLAEDSAVRKEIRVVRKFQNSTFSQEIRLSAGIPRVDIVTTADWHEKHILMKAAFALPVRSENATYEIPFGSIPRPTTRRTPEEKAKFEVPALRWADLSDSTYGVSILNDSKYGYDGRDNVLRLSLLRSPAYPDPHADEGTHRFTYAIYPHAGTWREGGTVRRGYELNYKLMVMQVPAHTGSLPPAHSFVKVEPENLVLTALKRSESGDGLVLRFYESAGKGVQARIQLPAAARAAFETNLMEKQEKELPAGKEIMVDVKPYEIKTIEVRLAPMKSVASSKEE